MPEGLAHHEDCEFAQKSWFTGPRPDFTPEESRRAVLSWLWTTRKKQGARNAAH